MTFVHRICSHLFLSRTRKKLELPRGCLILLAQGHCLLALANDLVQFLQVSWWLSCRTLAQWTSQVIFSYPKRKSTLPVWPDRTFIDPLFRNHWILHGLTEYPCIKIVIAVVVVVIIISSSISSSILQKEPFLFLTFAFRLWIIIVIIIIIIIVFFNLIYTIIQHISRAHS